MFTTLSTIFAPITTGLTSSPPLLHPRLLDITLLLPVLGAELAGARALAGEHDFCLGFSFEEEDVLELSLSLAAEAGLLGIDDTFGFPSAS